MLDMVFVGIAVALLLACGLRMLHDIRTRPSQQRPAPPPIAVTELGAQTLYEQRERAHMPEQLQRAVLALSETTLFSDKPVKLVARVDQVYWVDGLLVPVETKTRQRLEIDPYDALELAVQSVVMRNSTDTRVAGRRVATYGYVRIARQGLPPVYLRTELPDEQTVAAYHRRYHALRKGTQPAGQIGLRGAYSRRICRQCPYQRNCSYQPVKHPIH